jgi:uncharacterized protein HemY
MSLYYPRRKAKAALDKSIAALHRGDVDKVLHFAREAAAWRELARLAALGAALDRGLSEAEREAAGRN